MTVVRPAPFRLVPLVLTAALVVLVAPAASAHDVLGGSSPAAGSTVTVAPVEVRLTFAEPPTAQGLGVAVTGPDGASVATGAPRLVVNEVTQALVPLTRSGTYTVAYRVVSADGHPVAGTYTFVLALASSSAATPVPSATPTPGGSSALADPSVTNVSGTDLTPWILGVVLALVAGTVLGVVAARRRRP